MGKDDTRKVANLPALEMCAANKICIAKPIN